MSKEHHFSGRVKCSTPGAFYWNKYGSSFDAIMKAIKQTSVFPEE